MSNEACTPADSPSTREPNAKTDDWVAVDGNEAVAHVAYRASELIALYPITPSSSMGEWCDAWAAAGRPNLWGSIPRIVEMQSEGGAAGAVHGALQAGALATTFTASQGLLLMIPNMYKIAGELTPTVFHVSARTLATHALSIFGDHSDVMAVRGTGWALLSSASVQEAADMAAIAHAATLATRVPFLHFFDGFRVSHEVAKITVPDDRVLAAMFTDNDIRDHRARALSPDHPVIRGTAQNPDVFFQAREASSPWYAACPGLVQKAMDRFAALTGRSYRLFDYHGAKDPERIIVAMGSGAVTAMETADSLIAKGERVGVVVVRLYRPFDIERFMATIPPSVKAIAILDRVKEPGAVGEPLFQDVVTAIAAYRSGAGALPPRTLPVMIGGRYGLASKEFTPAMCKAVFDELKSRAPRARFTVGIQDDLSHSSLAFDPAFKVSSPRVTQALFWGLGADGTVGANKNSIKIICENTPLHAQGYFVYDSKKSGAVTVSHLRFGPDPIRAPWLVEEAGFVAVHQPQFLERYDVLRQAARNAVVLLNYPGAAPAVWDRLPGNVQRQILERNLRVHVIDADAVARVTGMGRRINTIMQTCFFAISGVLPRDEAVGHIKDAARKSYAKKGDQVVAKNLEAIDATLSHLHQITISGKEVTNADSQLTIPSIAPAFVRDVLGEIIAGRGDDLPVSAFPPDGTYPTGTAKWEKRNLAGAIPVWDEKICTQCGKCAFVCPHTAIRIKAYPPEAAAGAPVTFKHAKAREKEWAGLALTIQVAPEDCTACELCVDACPAVEKATGKRALVMAPQAPLRETERANFEFFLGLQPTPRALIDQSSVRQQQAMEPLFEFSGACTGCGETPYLKLLTQLFGDRLLIANATGCSSIFGGNLPTTPWTVNAEGRGPAWANSLFEDNAEFGLGMRLSVDKQAEYARELVRRLSGHLGDELCQGLLETAQTNEALIAAQRARVSAMRARLASSTEPDARRLETLADLLVRRSIWIVGGDGWAYDIGFGGLDHVLASGADVNILVLDTEVYSNTGGQMSKSTPCAAVARFAEGGKQTSKKDLGLIAMSYGNVYVSSVAMGARDRQTLKSFVEAESYPGVSLIIAYSHCIAHGFEISHGLKQQDAAVKSGHWNLYRYDPRLMMDGKNPLQLDSKKPAALMREFLMSENRFRQLARANPEEAERLFQAAQSAADIRWNMYEYLAKREGRDPVT